MPPNLLVQLRPKTVSVGILGRRWTLSAASAADWIGGIGWDPSGLSGILPGLLADEHTEDMFRLMLQHRDMEQRWFHASIAAIGYGSGRDWTWAYNLSMSSLQGWPYLNGLLLHRGIRSTDTSFPDWLDAVYMLLWERADESGRKQLDFELLLPPKDLKIPAASSVSSQKMLGAFAAD